MKRVKVFLCIAVVMIMLCNKTSDVYAAHEADCENPFVKAVCCEFYDGQYVSTHVLYITASGTAVECDVVAIRYYHNMECESCHGVFMRQVVIVCRNDHDYCPDETDLCQN